MPDQLDQLIGSLPATGQPPPAARDELDDLIGGLPPVATRAPEFPLAPMPVPRALQPDRPSLAQLRTAGELPPQPVPVGPRIEAAQPSGLDYARRFLFGGPQGETALGRAFPSMSGAKITDTPTSELPPIRAEELIPSESQFAGVEMPQIPGVVNPLATPLGRAATRGAAQAATGLTTAPNLGIMAATGGLGAFGEVAPIFMRAVNAGLSTYFAYHMGKDATEAVKQAYVAHKDGDDEEATRLLGFGSVNALMGAAAARHAIKSGVALPGDIAGAIEAHNAIADELIANDVRQGRGAELGQHIVGPEIPLQGTDGWKVTPNGADINGRPHYSVEDKTGKKIFGGNGSDVQSWLYQKGVAIPPPLDQPSPIVKQAETLAAQEAKTEPPKPADVERVSPATPNPPTAAIPTTPESPDTLALQLQQLGGPKPQRRVVMLPKGTEGPGPETYPDGTAVTHDNFGNVYVFRPDLIKRSDIHSAAKQNRLPEILGSADLGMGAPDKSELPPNPPVVVSRGTQGEEIQSTATAPHMVPMTVEAAQDVTPPGGSVSVESPANVIGEREGWLNEAEITDTARRLGLPLAEVQAAAHMPYDELEARANHYSDLYNAAIQRGATVSEIADANLDALGGLYHGLSQRAARALVAQGTPPPAAPPPSSTLSSTPGGSPAELPAPTPAADLAAPASIEQPEPQPGSEIIAPPGPRWTGDRGAMPGEPAYVLDEDEDGNGPAALVEIETPKGVLWEAVTSDGNSLGQFSFLDQAAKAAEAAYPEEPKLSPREKAQSQPSSTWMNRWDIQEKVDRTKQGTVIGDAARHLQAFQELVDDNSDGWPYWTIASNAAKRLMGLLQHNTDPTPADLAYALAPINAFKAKKLSHVTEEAAPTKQAPVEPETKHDFASTQANLAGPVADAVRSFANSIPDEKLAEDGRETQPHVTVRYGLHAEDPAAVAELLRNEPPITVRLGGTSLFQNEDADVLKVDVDSPDLHRLNAKIASLPHTDTHPDYTPHVTVAYLKPGEGAAYAGKAIPGITGQTVTLHEIAFSDKNGNQVAIPLGGGKAATEPEKLVAPAPVERPQKPVTPQIPNEPGTKYVLPSFVTGGGKKPQAAAAPQRHPAEQEVLRILGRGKMDEFSLPEYFHTREQFSYEEMKAALHALIRAGDVQHVQMPDGGRGFQRVIKAKPTEELAAPEPIEKPAVTEPAEKPAEVYNLSGAEALANEVYRHLKESEWIGNVTDLNKLAEKAWGTSRTSGTWTPKDAFDAMEAGINKYLAENGERLMKMDAIEGLKELRRLMLLIPSQGVRTEEQIKKQQFSTPPTQSYLAAKVAALRPTDVVLEPSAGNGGLAVWPKSIGAKTYVNEISDRRRMMLQIAGFENPGAVDGEVINSLLNQKIKPTVVLMNPPFSAGVVKSNEAKNRNVYGFNHVDSALQRLEPGGRLVAILGGGQANEPGGGASLISGASGKWFLGIANRYNVRANVRISGKEYQKYGTSFATRIIVIDKTGPTPLGPGQATLANRWANVVQGNVDTLEEAYGLLRGVEESRPVSQTEAVQSRPGGEASARPGDAGTGVGTSQDASGERHPEPIQGERAPAQEGELPGRPPQSLGSAGANQPSAGGKQPPLREPESGPAKPAETAAAEHPASGAHDVDTERPLGGGETVAPAGEEPLNLEPTNGEIEKQDADDQSVYVTYKPSIQGGAHPGDIVETATMATVPLPKATYRPNLPKDAGISAVQMEAVAIAGQQNAIVLPGGARASALIGDGTGVGKGRISAAILYDNYRQGRKRLVWVSEKWDLMQDAMRDFDGMGAKEIMRGITHEGGKYVQGANAGVIPLRKYKVTDKIQHDGVVFTTYALIRSKDKKGNRRTAQLEQYLRGDDDGEGAYILFDESHNLKNAVVAQGGQVSQIGEAVKELLERMPKLRTTSLSATAATDVINLGYLDRLGLWGPGTAFPNGFSEFGSQVASGGMAAMELIAREMKAQGKYLSRTLSFKGVDYSEAEHTLAADQKDLYRTAAKAWSTVIQRAEDTIKNTTNGGSFAKGRFMSLLAGAQQRFFNVLITTFKIPTAIELANKALDQDKSVVITLVNTNEAAQNREKNKARDEGDDDEEPDYDFGPKEMLLDLIKQHYPTQQFVDDVDSSGNPVKRPLYTTNENGDEVPVQNPQAIAERDALVQQISSDLHLPENPLDLLIQGLGGHNKVAELTGRKEYYDRSRGQFIPRGDPNVARKDVNLYEMRAFQSGKKRVAILSGAAGTGISLHADKGAANKQRRYQITLQVGWSADKQMQMFGRTHRTNQVSAPEYVMLVSDLGGEKRFVSTIARRLGSLGALTKGQKNATSGTDLMEKVNFETEQGRRATDNFYGALLRGESVPGTNLAGIDVLAALRVLRTESSGAVTVAPEDRTNVTRLLNRLLALDPDIQNAVYNFFYDIFQATVQQAIENGTLDTGVRTLPGDEFEIGNERTIAKDPATGAETRYSPVSAKIRTERVSVADMHKRLKQYEHAKVITSKGEVALARPAPPIVHANGHLEAAVYVSKPGQGRWTKLSNDEAFIRNSKFVDKWAKEEADRLSNEVKSAQHNADYYRKQIGEKTNRERSERERVAAQRISSLESRLAYMMAEDLKPRTQAELVKAREEFEAAKTYELPEDDWQRDSLTAAEEKLERVKTEQAAADVIAKNPMSWADEKWEEAYEKAPSHITEEHHFITGAVLRFWNPIKEATFIRNSIYTATDGKTGKRVVGVDIPKEAIRQLLNRIEGGQSTVDFHQLATDVLQNNLTYTLEGNIQVRRGRVGKEHVIQLIPPSQDVANTLKGLGILYERGVVPVYYAPNNTNANQGATRMSVMKRVMEQFPVKPETPAGDSVYLGAGLGALQPHLEKLVRENLLPELKKGTRWATAVWDEMLKTFAPQARGPLAKEVTGSLREMMGKLAHAEARTHAAMEQFREAFYKLPAEHGVHGLDIIDAIEGSDIASIDDQVFRKFAETARRLYDDRKELLEKLDIVRNFLEGYFTHMYKDPAKAEAWTTSWLSRRPMAGREAFRKKRTYPTLREALEDPEFGLVAAFDNPVDFVYAGLQQMDKSIYAHEFFEEWSENNQLKFGRRAPVPGWEQINDRLFTVYGPRRGAVKISPREPKPEQFGDDEEYENAHAAWEQKMEALDEGFIKPEDVEVIGQRVMGHYWAPSQLAVPINNYLKPGLRGKAWFDGWMKLKGAWNAINLGFSAFHGATTTLNASMNDFALGVKDLFAGRPIQAGKNMARSIVPFASVSKDVKRGGYLEKVYRGEIENPDAMSLAVVDALVKSGYRQEQDYSLFWKGLKKAWAEDKRLGATVRALNPLLWAEVLNKPIMRKLVPRAKLAAFEKAMQFEIERHPDMDIEEARKRFAEISDSMDDRLGQLNQSNMLWNGIVRDLGNAIIGRPGWNYGFLRTTGGGIADIIGNLNDLARGRRPEISHRTAYVIAMVAFGAIANAIAQFLLTGEMAHDWDYLFPRDGGKNADGTPSRTLLPLYLSKDLYSWSTRPVMTLLAKLAQPLMTAGQLAQNRDFHNEKIYGRGGIGIGQYILDLFTPYAVSGALKNVERGESLAKTVLPFVGILPASSRAGQTKAQRIITEYRDDQRRNTRPAPTDRTRARNLVLTAAQRDQNEGRRVGAEQIRRGALSKEDVKSSLNRAKQGSLLNDIHNISDLDVVLHAYDAANDDEKKLIQKEVRNKILRARGQAYRWTPEARELAQKYFRITPRVPYRSVTPPNQDLAAPSTLY